MIKAKHAGQPEDKTPRRFWSLPESERKSRKIVVFLRLDDKRKIVEAARVAGCSASVFMAEAALEKIDKKKGPQ